MIDLLAPRPTRLEQAGLLARTGLGRVALWSPAAQGTGMRAVEGVVTIVQESRFQLTDDLGVSHLFILGPGAGAEPDQLSPLAREQSRVRVAYDEARNAIGRVAHSVRRI